MKNVLQIGAHLAPNLVGGAEVSANEIARQLEKGGFSVIGYSTKINNIQKVSTIRYTGSLHWLSAEHRLAGLKKYLYYLLEQVNFGPPLRLLFFAKREKIDLLLVHSWRGLGEWLPIAAILTRKPVVFVLHDFAFVCVNKGARRGDRNCQRQCFSCACSSKLRILAARLPNVALVAPSRAHADAVEMLAERDLNIHVINNPNIYEVETRLRRPDGRLTFGYVGRLEEDKGFGTFIALARAFSGRASFLVAGDGAMAAEAMEAVGAGHLRYLGKVSKEAISKVYNELDVLVVPSKWRENFPGVCVEALLSGLPVLGAKMGGIPEVITDKLTGELLPPDDLEAWHAAVASLIMQPELVETYSRHCLQESSRFDPKVSFGKYQKLIQQMLGTGSQR